MTISCLCHLGVRITDKYLHVQFRSWSLISVFRLFAFGTIIYILMLKSAVLSLFSTWVLFFKTVFLFYVFRMYYLNFFFLKNAILNVFECILYTPSPGFPVGIVSQTITHQSLLVVTFDQFECSIQTLAIFMSLSFLFKIQFS